MPRIPRKEVIDPTEVGVFHCINRCVRRAFLCGADPFSGKNYDHRKSWLQDRMQFLAANFGIDVLAFSILSNHFHIVLRIRPDVVAGWTDDDVALRWWRLFPARKNKDGTPAEPEDHDLRRITGDASRLAEIRKRLSSISWFMRCLVETIARRSNREDQVSGRFWQGRFQAVPLLDDAALAACMAYVDLNPIRAGIADTPETSQFTSAYERIQGARDIVLPDDSMIVERVPTEQIATDPILEEPVATQPLSTGTTRGGWLSPIPLADESSEPVPTARASNKGCLGMSLADYLELLDWSGRQLRTDKSGAIPDGLAPILERLQITDKGWRQLIAQFSRIFRRAAGTPASILQDIQKRGRQRAPGIARSRILFA